MEYWQIIKNTKVYGLENAIRVSKFAMSTDTEKCTDVITDTVNKLAEQSAGTGHSNFLLGIVVQCDLTFTIKAWTEFERYHFADIITSQSTMHKITKMDIAKNCISYVNPDVIDILNKLIDDYNINKTPENYLKVLYNVPVGLKLTAGITTNYLQLKTIYKQRKDHRLPEWKAFCKWCEILPNSQWITSKSENSLK